MPSTAAATLAALLSSPIAQAEAPEAWIPFETYKLDNGLNVILSEDHSVPFVWVNVWYDVGSKDELPGRTGFAHLFEHLMFQGSGNIDTEYFQPLQAIGASINGTTNLDRTNYYEGVPAEQLPLALWMESDRMGFLLEALSQEKLDNQREVVRNERRQRYENRPYGEVYPWMMEALYPEGHPYHVPTIGKHEDLEAATMEDVTTFFNTWYVPNNASISICGDFDPAEAKALIQTYFSGLPPGPQPTPRTSAEASLTEEKVVRKTDDVPHQKVILAWISPALYAPGDAELDVLSGLLADGKDSRLYTELVREQQIAKDVEAYQYSARLHGQYIIEATAAEGHSTDELVSAIDTVLAELREGGPTAEEVAVSKTNWQAHFYEGLLSISRKADMLQNYNNRTGDPGFITKDIARYVAVDAAAVHDTLKTWLPADRRVVLHVVPETPAESTKEEN